jgi:two-component system chemotaxis sensor kinase CheA
MSYDDAKLTFSQEAEGLLEQMELALLALEASPGDPELLNQVFRAMHTIKGAAGVFGFDPVVSFTHEVETLLDKVRAGSRALDAGLVAILLECRDHTLALVKAVLDAADPKDIDPALKSRGAEVVARLTGGGLQPAQDSQAGLVEKLGGRAGGEDNWIIILRFGPDALRNGIDPLSFLRYLGSLGDILEVVTLTERLPRAAQFDPEHCYLDFRIFFRSDADKKTIEAVFEFAEDDCEIRILPPHSRVEQYLQVLESVPEDQVIRLGELLVQIGALTDKEIDKALHLQGQEALTQPASATRPLGQILVEQELIQKPVVEQALRKQEQAKERAAQEAQYIRVDAQRLGYLINLVGELVINSATMQVMVERHGLDDVQEVVDGIKRLVAEIRDNALQLRMVQIGETFTRFRRLVRDVSKELGKDIDLVITGGETELDKTVVEKIVDPLTHLIRNSVDHGIEAPETRAALGKPAKGTVQLSACHDSGHIVIQIKDDGAGLDPVRIRAKAEDKGMVRPDQVLSRAETFRLIFEPGLSTKDQASNLSGRGVGMDVVRRDIEGLRGSVELDSAEGQGTQVTIVLPLTLAIIDGFLVESNGEHYVIPLGQVVECVEIDSGHEGHQQYMNLRGEVLPYLRLKEFFSAHAGPAQGDRESLVVVRFGHEKAGLVVDHLHGELQTVIKPLGPLFEQLKGVAGATILGSGDIALILDVQALTGLAHARAGFVRGREKLLS